MPTEDRKRHVIMLMKEAVSRGAPAETLSLFPAETDPLGDLNFVDWEAVEDRLTTWLNQTPPPKHAARATGDSVTSIDDPPGVR